MIRAYTSDHFLIVHAFKLKGASKYKDLKEKYSLKQIIKTKPC